MKILFLDIDGVLNCDTTQERLGEEFGIFRSFMGIDLQLLDRLKRWLIGQPEVEVVLSSTWRLKRRMAEEVRRQGIEYIGTTRNLTNRATEVDDWLAAHPQVTHYAILDDILQFSARQRPHFVKTSAKHGLREKDLRALEVILDLKSAGGTFEGPITLSLVQQAMTILDANQPDSEDQTIMIFPYEPTIKAP